MKSTTCESNEAKGVSDAATAQTRYGEYIMMRQIMF